MRPLILVAASALGVAAAWAVNFRARLKRVGHHLLPRFFLLIALYERLPELTSIYVDEREWESFSDKILSCLSKIRDAADGMSLNDQELQAVQTELGSRNGQELLHTASSWNVERSVHRVSDAVDRCLLPYLQSQEEVAMLLRDYLPKPKQSWEAFIDTKLEDSEKAFFGLNQHHANIDDELEALKACGRLVIQFISEIQNVSKVIVGATRGSKEKAPDTRRKQRPNFYTEVKVFYATDRKITEDAEYVGERSVERGLHYGLVVVGIPNVHKAGYLEAPTGNSEEANPLKHVVILSINTSLRGDRTGFIRKINEELDQKGSGFKHNIFLYIHGYNVHHKDAIKRAAQLKYDLQLEGVVIVYSWPSKGTLWGYQHDGEVIKLTASYLESFIQTILSEVCSDAKVHILAHSMGNRALIKALQGIQPKNDSLPQPMGSLTNVIFAAADETRTEFENMVTSLRRGTEGAKVPPRITVYSSICDIALHTSKMLHWKVRLGDTRSFFERPNREDNSPDVVEDNSPDVVDASGVDASRVHHSYYGDVPEVIRDIQELLTSSSAEERARQGNAVIKPVSYNDKLFYAFNPKMLKKVFHSLKVQLER